MQAPLDDNPLAGFDAGARKMITEQAKVCYMNVDRTLATWTRTAMSLIVLGVILDRYGILVTVPRTHAGTPLASDPLYSTGGIVLVALGTLIALVTAFRHQVYRRRWNRVFAEFGAFGPWLAFVFAAGGAAAGITLTILLLLFRH
ncbi:MAG: DUF202 domain-containing protein [Rhodanobacteraceae bacterium]|nr:MAG: DUF202 domain-containing protein [Rhodanobacteraceae bacterium]